MSRANVKYDTLQGGIEISGATLASSGTLGAIVYSEDTGAPMILTNRHVVGDEKVKEEARRIVDLVQLKVKAGVKPVWWKDEYVQMLEDRLPVFQPAYRGGTSRDSRLVAFVTLASGRSDAAVCTLADGIAHNGLVTASPSFSIAGIGKARKDMLVMKSGKETDVTWGVVTAVDGENIIIEHPFHEFLPIPGKEEPTRGAEALRTEPNLVLQAPLVVQGAISAAGDSGAVWVNAETKEAVGLLYRGMSPFTHGKNYSVATDMAAVARKLKFNFG